MENERGAIHLSTQPNGRSPETSPSEGTARAIHEGRLRLAAVRDSRVVHTVRTRLDPALAYTVPTGTGTQIPLWRLIVCALCMAVLGFGLYRQLAPGVYQIPFTDFQSFYNAAVAVRHGGDPYVSAVAWLKGYTPTGDGTLFATKSFVYPPFFALMLLPLTYLPLLGALIFWDVANLVFMFGAMYVPLRIAGKRPSLTSILLLTTAFSLISAVRKEWSLGQTDIFLLFVICCAFWARIEDRRGVAGLLLALACVTKPAFIVLVVFLLWKREYKFALVTFATFLVLLLGPFLWLGGQTWRDQLTVWSFWSNQYVAYAQNISPKGVLARLFTVNPVVRPLAAAPVLVTVLWLVIVAVVLVLTVAVVSPKPLQRNTRSLLELGVVITALFLMSPLTEWPYLLLLAIPVLACYSWLREGDWRLPRARLVLVGAIATWLLLLEPLTSVENLLIAHFRGQVHTTSLIPVLFVVIAPVYLYALIAVFALQLHVMSLIAGRTTLVAVRQFISDIPAQALSWLQDTKEAFDVTTGRTRPGTTTFTTTKADRVRIESRA